jgi:mono/diheme cytochrome c family protein
VTRTGRISGAAVRGFATAVLLTIVCLGSSSCEKKERTPAERGQRSFVRLCAGCHGADGRGTKQPGFKVPPRDLTDASLQTQLADDDLKRTIRNGKGQMPAFGPLMPEQDLNDLVQFVRTLAKR